MKLAVLVIASKGEPYDSFLRNWRSYPFPEWVKVWYVFMEENLPTPIQVEGDTIKVCGQECVLPGIHYKTREAMQWITENYDYDVLLRSNLSSWYNFEKLRAWFEESPKEGYMFGTLWEPSPFGEPFLSGCGYAMNKDIVKQFLNWNAEEYMNVMCIYDDLIVWYFMKTSNIPYKDWMLKIYDVNMTAEDMMEEMHCRFKIRDSLKDISTSLSDTEMQARVINLQIKKL